MMTMQHTTPVTVDECADDAALDTPASPTPQLPVPATGAPALRPAWVQPLAAAAEQLGIELDVYTVLAKEACGCWWLRDTTTTISRKDSDTISRWVEGMGLLGVLQAHGPGDPATVPTVRNEADVARVKRLINDNIALFDGRTGRWIIGDVLRLMWESKATMRILTERGIAIGDMFHGIEAALGSSVLRNTGERFRRDVIRELSCLHRGRLAFLFVEERPGGHRLIARERQQAQVCTSTRVPAGRSAHHVEFEVGQVVWVAVEETTNGRKSRKRHPAVLIARTGKSNAKWLIVTMTTDVPGQPDFRRVPDAAALGLDYPGFVWHEVQKVHKSQVEHTVGWVHRPLLEVIHRTVGLRQAQYDELRGIAEAHHAATRR